MVELEISDLSVKYGKVPALRNLSLRVAEREIVGLIGPNGAGKSTTLKCVFGLVRAQSGTVRYKGQDLLGQRPDRIVRAGLALVPEGRRIFTSLTVEENLRLGRAGDSTDDADAMEEMLQRFPILKHYYRVSAAGLSGGEQQQLAIARALLSRPRLLLLDEPSLGLAPMIVDEVFSLLTDLRNRGMTILLVEQNAARTVAWADRTYVLRSGELVMEGTQQEFAAVEDLSALYFDTAARA